MMLVFLERELPGGKVEITLRQGRDELKRAIGGKIPFPEKMILTKEQREENKDNMKDLLAGAFCLEELVGVPFVVKNEKGEILEDYYKSAYDNIGGKA
jgi:hypothetical protein